MFQPLRWLSKPFKRSSTSLPPAIEPQLIFEELEPRTLYSADPLGGLIDTTELLGQEGLDFIPAEILLIDGDTQNNAASDKDSNDLVSKAQTFTSNISTEIRHELVIVDASVENYEQLIDDLISNGKEARDISVFVLDSENNGIDQITEKLQNYDDLDALHIISHGTKGAVVLGNTQLSSSNLENYSGSIAQWQNSFDPEADLLIYGCELAGNAAGKALTAELSVLTSADVAASVDDTGNALQGGDWELEFSTGVIETNIAFSNQVQKSWDGLLAFETYRDEFNAVSYSNSDGSQDWTGTSWQEIGESNGANAGQVLVSTELGEQGLVFKQSSNGALREVDLSGASSASLSFEYARISLDNASESIVLEISDDGGSTWNQLDSWQGTNDDSSLIFADYDISDYIAANTQIRFVSNGFNEANDKFFIDNVQIAFNSNLSEKSEFLINNPDGNSQETSSQDRGSHQAVAVASNGDYVVVWTEVESTGDLSDVFARQYNADGTAKAGGVFQVNSTSANEQQWASVASDASGRFVVVWTSQNQDGDGQGIYLKRFNADGTEIDTVDILVNSSNITDNQSNASIALNSQGEMVITWQSDEAGNEGIYAKTFDMTSAATGNSVPTSLITVDTGSNRLNPSVDINSEGKFVIAWQKDQEPYVQRFNSDGSLRGAQIDINPLTSLTEKFPVVAIQESGDFLVAYRSEIGGFQGVWVKHYKDSGSAHNFFATKVSSDSSNTAPSIDIDLEGNFIIVSEGSGDGDGQGIFARQYDSSRNAIGTGFQINETISGDQQMASIAMLDLDTYVVVWSGNGTGDANGVYARQYTAPNNPPTADADAGSPYVITEGDSVMFNGSNSSDPDLDPLIFSWDLDNNGSYGDVVGENPIVSWPTLQSNGINDDGVYTIGLQVDDGKGGVDTTTTTIIVNNQAPVLSTTGNTTNNQGSVYTLNLSVTDSGDDTISSWTINWGDGAIDTFAGNPATVTHTYTNGGFTNNILASATDEDGTYLQNSLVVVDFSTDSVFRFDTSSGALIASEFATGNGINNPVDVKIGPDGLLYVSSEVSNDILRYNASTGAFVDTFVDAATTAQLDTVEGIAFGPDGNLYVADFDGKVVRFDATTGNFIDVFVAKGLGGLNQAYGIIFGPDNNLYVSSFNNDNVIKYNGITGDLISEFVTSGSGGLDRPEEMVFGPDGNLYVTSFNSDDVLRYSGSTGAFIDKFIDSNAAIGINGGLLKPAGLAFGADGNLYVSDFANSAIRRYDSATGVYIDDYVAAGTGGLTQPVFLEFLPQQQVTVNPLTNNTPTTSGLTDITVNEDAPDSVIDLLAAFTDVEDLDTDLIYSIQSNSNAGLFTASTLDAAANSLTLDYAPNQNGSSDITIRATDSGGEFVEASFTVTVNAVNDPPTTSGLADVTVNENAPDSVIDLLAAFTDVEDLDTDLIYTIQGNTNAGLFTTSTLDAAANTLTLDYALNQNGSSDITIRATDSGGEFVEASFTVTVNAVNNTPATTGLANITVNEDAADSVIDLLATFTDVEDLDTDLIYTIQSNTNTGLFTASTLDAAANTLTLDYAPNQNGSSDITVRATDSGGAFVEASFTVTVNAVNNTPIIDNHTFSIVENSTNGAVVGTVIASDPDPLDSLNFSIVSGNSNQAFAINSSTGEITVADRNLLNFENTSTFNLTVQVQDNGVGNLSNTSSITINLIDINEAPGSISLSNTSIDENVDTSSGYSVGQLTSTDVDVADTAFYIISGGTDQEKFSVGGSDNNELILNNGVLDFTRQSSYEVIISVTDSGGLSNEETFTITVTNINDKPAITSNDTLTLAENNSNVTTVIATDADQPAQNLNFSVSGGVDSALFLIDSNTGELTFKVTPDFENPVDSNGDNVYQLEVTVDDGNGGTFSQNISIQIENAPESPNLQDQTFILNEQVDTGTLLATLLASDPDLNETLIYSITDSTLPGAFTIDNSNQLIVQDNTALTGLDNPLISLTIKVTDSQGLTDTSTIQIDVGALQEEVTAMPENNVAQEQEIEVEPENEINPENDLDSEIGTILDNEIEVGQQEEEFSFSILTKIPSEEPIINPQNRTDLEIDLTVPLEQQEPENEIVEEIIEQTNPEIIPNLPIIVGLDTFERGFQDSLLSTRQQNSQDIHRSSFTRDVDKILIEVKSFLENNQLNPQFNYFNIEVKAMKFLLEKSGFVDSLDTLREQTQVNTNFEKTIVGSSVTVATGLSIGYVIWLIRGGVLLSSVLSSLPAWRMIDPLPILAHLGDSSKNDDSDSLEALIKKGNKVVTAKLKSIQPKLN